MRLVGADVLTFELLAGLITATAGAAEERTVDGYTEAKGGQADLAR
jgi:hypothetical protein